MFGGKWSAFVCVYLEMFLIFMNFGEGVCLFFFLFNVYYEMISPFRNSNENVYNFFMNIDKYPYLLGIWVIYILFILFRGFSINDYIFYVYLEMFILFRWIIRKVHIFMCLLRNIHTFLDEWSEKFIYSDVCLDTFTVFSGLVKKYHTFYYF